MRQDLYINGYNAWNQWKLSLSDGAIAALMTPPPVKARAEIASRQRHGKTILLPANGDVMDARELALPMFISAPDSTTGLQYYNAFCTNVLFNGKIDLQCKELQTQEFHLWYLSCSNFSQMHRELFTFTLKVTEPNPSDRAITHSNIEF